MVLWLEGAAPIYYQCNSRSLSEDFQRWLKFYGKFLHNADIHRVQVHLVSEDVVYTVYSLSLIVIVQHLMSNIHYGVSEFVTQSCVLMYYNLWNIRKATSHYFSDCSSDQGTYKKAKWQLGSKCPSSYSTLKASIASQILTTTGDLFLRGPFAVHRFKTSIVI